MKLFVLLIVLTLIAGSSGCSSSKSTQKNEARTGNSSPNAANANTGSPEMASQTVSVDAVALWIINPDLRRMRRGQTRGQWSTREARLRRRCDRQPLRIRKSLRPWERMEVLSRFDGLRITRSSNAWNRPGPTMANLRRLRYFYAEAASLMRRAMG